MSVGGDAAGISPYKTQQVMDVTENTPTTVPHVTETHVQIRSLGEAFCPAEHPQQGGPGLQSGDQPLRAGHTAGGHCDRHSGSGVGQPKAGQSGEDPPPLGPDNRTRQSAADPAMGEHRRSVGFVQGRGATWIALLEFTRKVVFSF